MEEGGMARPKKNLQGQPGALKRDEAEDDQEHMIEDGTNYDWARKVSEEEAAGLD
jgi:hypothetical protein